MTGTFDHLVKKAFHDQAASELVAQKVDAIKGISAGDAQHLREAFGIETVADLASHRFMATARAIFEASQIAAEAPLPDLRHDAGPDASWTARFARAPLSAYRDHPAEFRLDFGPVYYRGRLDGTARVVVIGQDPAGNELLAQRNFVGTSGQRLQRFLEKLGVTRDYVMLNTFLYPVYGQVTGVLAQLLHDPAIEAYRNELLDHVVDKNPIQAVITVGGAAKTAVEAWLHPRKPPVVAIMHPSARNNAALLANWNLGLASLLDLVAPELHVAPDPAPYEARWRPEDQIPIPRFDLPFGTPEWHGVGDHGVRPKKPDGTTDPKRIEWRAP